MTEDPEPPENISGGAAGGGTAAAFTRGTADNRAERVVDRLGAMYWEKAYGGQDAFECLVRTVLSQNTSDKASQPAHDALMTRYRDSAPDASDGDLAVSLARADVDTLADTIRHAGLYNQKARTIVALGDHVITEYGGAAGFDRFVKTEDPGVVRERLLDLGGVGPKTADCVLLFAGGRDGVFPVDTHVHRIYRRLGIAPPDADHESVREILERDVPPVKCGFGHTASIQFGREYCTAREPACLDGPDACPLADLCDRIGIDAVDGIVVDPANATD